MHLLIILAMLCAPIDLAQTQRFRARLSTVPIEVVMQATVAGSGAVKATLTGPTLTLTGEFSGLKSAATFAKLHAGPNKGLRGPAIADLTISKSTSGTISGSFDLTPQQIDDLKNGRVYIQLHSEQAADGNLWGWLLPEEARR